MPSYSQNYPPFINLSKNKIYKNKDSSDFQQFKQKWNQFLRGNKKHISIIHFGGSHVQGGFWSESIMNTLQEKNNTSGGGYFVFPFQQIKTNTPYYFKTYSNVKWKANKCTKITDTIHPIGMAGVSASIDTTCYIAIKNNWNKLKGYTTIRFFHRFNNDYEIIPQFQTSNIKHYPNYSEYTLSSVQDSVSFIIEKKIHTQSEFILDGISCENNNEQGIYYAGFGVNGATSGSFIKCKLLAQEIKNLSADIFILSFGVNDVRNKNFQPNEYIQNYDSLLKILHQTHPHTPILITTISDNYIKRKNCNKKTITGNLAIFEMLKNQSITVWDLNGIMGGYQSMNKWFKAGLSAKDKIHFNKKGYDILGKLLAEALIQ